MTLADSFERATVLYEALTSGELDRDSCRELVDHYWPICEAWVGLGLEILDELEKLAPLGDPLPTKAPVLEVFRATVGEAPDGGSWTLNEEIAERFAHIFMGPRALVYGVFSPRTVVWRADVDRESVLGYYKGRNEEEVVLPPGAVSFVEPVTEIELVRED